MKLNIFFSGIRGGLLLLLIFLVSCSTPETDRLNSEIDSENEVLQIYTTLYPLVDFTKKIGGELVEVVSIIPPGVDTHSFEPSTKTMIEIAEADAFIFSSDNMEQYAAKIAESLNNENVIMVEAADGIEMIEHDHIHSEADSTHQEDGYAEEDGDHEGDAHVEEEHEHAHGDFDPHVWIDPILAITLAENIKDTLVELRPNAKDQFEENFQSLKVQLEQLDREFHEMIEQKSDPKILVSHAAYGYWERNYGIKQIAVAGLSPTNEPSQKQLEEIIQTAKENNIKYVIFEKNITAKITEIVKNELKADALYLHNLANLTDEDIKNNEDYFSLMRKNIETLDQTME